MVALFYISQMWGSIFDGWTKKKSKQISEKRQSKQLLTMKLHRVTGNNFNTLPAVT